ncbi:stemmadenine O-acetyltransferase-like [Vicia villosa]|uniref:stemmadenine O-acetyltransferase-like n=1 Tax=Vicia villosa TaxID=3911 RepID=UPI00273BF9EA|nr:stemmadenine O-acetyltransferase-like [Vicia villosa]
MEIERVSRETIKPSSPTPCHLRIYPLSFIDNMFVCNVPLLLFYNPDKSNDQFSKISQLKRSLSHVLSKYYIFAGRLKDRITIECEDQGVPFLVTKITNKLSDILQHPEEKLLNSLFADGLQWKDADSSVALVAIQINCFECGGMAISICMNHRCGDASTLINFMKEWAIINKKLQEEENGEELLIVPFPLLEGGASIFPQKNLPIFPQSVLNRQKNMIGKRFVFQPKIINFLKELASSSYVLYPSRVLVVKAWIYKHAVSSMGLNFKTSSFQMAVDLRKRMIPPLSEKCVGNIVWMSSMIADKEEMELKDVVCKIKQGLCEFCDIYPKLFGGNNFSLLSEFMNKIIDLKSKKKDGIGFSSWCNFAVYEVDFGWGKPTWVTTCGCPWKNFVILMDRKDGNGIDAIVSLEENHMTKFEHEYVELLRYASPKL